MKSRGLGLTSSFTSLLAGTIRPSARTTVTSMMLSMVRPYLPERLPIPPPSVNLLHQSCTSCTCEHPLTLQHQSDHQLREYRDQNSTHMTDSAANCTEPRRRGDSINISPKSSTSNSDRLGIDVHDHLGDVSREINDDSTFTRRCSGRIMSTA
jgi:hypothetical protein